MITYIGMDFEASGDKPWQGSVPVQIGFALEDGYERTELIGGWDWNEWDWNEVAAGIHNISQETLATANPAWKVDILLAADLMDRIGKSKMFNVCVGWNVAGYDRQFILRWFPSLNRILSYRNLDLNSLVFRAAGYSEKRYNDIKTAAKEYAAQELQREAAWHDAGYDAAAALKSMKYLSQLLETPEVSPWLT